jgi:hypothetical protein
MPSSEKDRPAYGVMGGAGDDPDVMPSAESDAEPIEVGWYAYSGGRQTMIFHLREGGQWSAHFDNGTASDCAWGYIGQALGVWDLVRVMPPGEGKADA